MPSARDGGAEERMVETFPRQIACGDGSKDNLLKELAGLKVPEGERGEVVRRERACFKSHWQRLDYRARAQDGRIGSGASFLILAS